MDVAVILCAMILENNIAQMPLSGQQIVASLHSNKEYPENNIPSLFLFMLSFCVCAGNNLTNKNN